MTKKAELIGMLKKPFGAKRETIIAKLGWQEHSVHWQISLLKKDGYSIVGVLHPYNYTSFIVTKWITKIKTILLY